MTNYIRTQPIVRITDPDCQSGYEETQSPLYRNCKLKTDLALVDAIRDFLTEIAEEGHLTEKTLRRNTGFIVGILSIE